MCVFAMVLHTHVCVCDGVTHACVCLRWCYTLMCVFAMVLHMHVCVRVCMQANADIRSQDPSS